MSAGGPLDSVARVIGCYFGHCVVRVSVLAYRRAGLMPLRCLIVFGFKGTVSRPDGCCPTCPMWGY